jgi:hypothetical protein
MELSASCLTVRTTVEQAVAENMHHGLAFGRAHDDWQRLLAKRREQDELWYFAPPDSSAIQLWGVALVRGGKVVSTVITAVT